MKKGRKEDPLDGFIKEKVFIKVTSKKGFNSFVKELEKAHPEVTYEISKSMYDDFGVNKLSKEYHLVYFHKVKKVKCADKEFFDFVYKTKWPFASSNASDKIVWLEV